jgi:hypothetical protein
MIHQFLSSEIVKVDDISYISALVKKSDYPLMIYKYDIYLNNSVKIEQKLVFRIKKHYIYSSDLKNIEVITCLFTPNVLIEDTAEVKNDGNYVVYEETKTYKEFVHNYNQLVGKFSSGIV